MRRHYNTIGEKSQVNTQIQGNRISIGYKLPLQTGICCAGGSPCKLLLEYEGQLIALHDARYRENRVPQLLRRRKNGSRNQPQETFSLNSNYVVSRGETVRLGFEPDSASPFARGAGRFRRVQKKTEPQKWLCLLWHPQQESNL